MLNIFLLCSYLVLPALCQPDERWEDMGTYLAMDNHYYSWYRQWQINEFSFAQHVAKKNRWQLSNQAIGYHQSDFNPKVIYSRLFNYKRVEVEKRVVDTQAKVFNKTFNSSL